jgi:2-amino-4-hydroxy-6-hydroxymethyldihydropteridine diphosphokinase
LAVTTEPYRVVLGLGSNQPSNLGDPLTLLRRAAELLEERQVLAIEGRSHVVASPAVGPPQPDYLNAAVIGTTTLAPETLLDAVLAIERMLGRQRPDAVRWGPRTIDIDILWSDAGAYAGPTLSIPHPRLRERSFALQPLLELAPEAIDPHTGARYSELEIAPLPRVAIL